MALLDRESYIVYKIKNVLNLKVYVGVTTRSLSERWQQHIWFSKSNNSAFGSAIKKHGKDNFKITILEECKSKQHMLEQEKYWISKLNSYANTGHGYNMTFGGDGLFGYKHTDEAKSSMSKNRTGDKNHNHGKRWGRTNHPSEFIEMMSKKHSGKGNPMYGLKHTETARQKISESNRARTYRTTPVLQFDLDGDFIKRFESVQSAAREVCGDDSKILLVCKGNRKTHKKYKWQYAKEGK